MYVQKDCEFQEINETYGLIMTQLKDRVELIKLEVKQATDEQDKLTEVTKSEQRNKTWCCEWSPTGSAWSNKCNPRRFNTT